MIVPMHTEIKNTQKVGKNAFQSDNTRQNGNFRENPPFQSYEQCKNKQITYLLPTGFSQEEVNRIPSKICILLFLDNLWFDHLQAGFKKKRQIEHCF